MHYHQKKVFMLHKICASASFIRRGLIFLCFTLSYEASAMGSCALVILNTCYTQKLFLNGKLCTLKLYSWIQHYLFSALLSSSEQETKPYKQNYRPLAKLHPSGTCFAWHCAFLAQVRSNEEVKQSSRFCHLDISALETGWPVDEAIKPVEIHACKVLY